MRLFEPLPEWVASLYAAALGVCAAAFVLRWLARRWRYRDRRTLAAEPRCGGCGYIIRPGASVVCPECGSDLRERGIVTPSTLPPLPVWPWYVGAVLLAAPAGLLAGRVVQKW